jgi:hypothetical protein
MKCFGLALVWFQDCSWPSTSEGKLRLHEASSGAIPLGAFVLVFGSFHNGELGMVSESEYGLQHFEVRLLDRHRHEAWASCLAAGFDDAKKRVEQEYQGCTAVQITVINVAPEDE